MATANVSSKSSSSKSESRDKQRPVFTMGFPVSVAVFEFANASDDGPPNFSTKLTRAFRRDPDSDWEHSEFLGAGDLLRGAKLLEAADAFVQSRLETHYRGRKSE